MTPTEFVVKTREGKYDIEAAVRVIGTDLLVAIWGAKQANFDLGLVTRHTLAEAATAETPEPPRRDPETRQRGRALVAEDNAVNQRVAARILEKLGCQVDVAANGREAIEMIERTAYDLIFMDYLAKPVSPEDFENALNRWLGQPGSDHS